MPAHRRYGNAAHLPDQPPPDGYWGTTDVDAAEGTDRAERRG